MGSTGPEAYRTPGLSGCTLTKGNRRTRRNTAITMMGTPQHTRPIRPTRTTRISHLPTSPPLHRTTNTNTRRTSRCTMTPSQNSKLHPTPVYITHLRCRIRTCMQHLLHPSRRICTLRLRRRNPRTCTRRLYIHYHRPSTQHPHPYML